MTHKVPIITKNIIWLYAEYIKKILIIKRPDSMASNINKDQYVNDGIAVVAQDASCDSTETDVQGMYFTRPPEPSPKRFTKKVVRKTLQRMKKSPANKTTIVPVNKNERKHTKSKGKQSHIYDEDGYTIANPENDPARVCCLVTDNATINLTHQEQDAALEDAQVHQPAYLSRRFSLANCRVSKRFVVGVSIVACILIVFILGFVLGFKSSKNHSGMTI